MDNIEALIDCVAGAIVAAHGSGGRWRLDLPRIAAVGETLGVLPHEIDEGGTYFAAISDRVVGLSLTVPTPEDAHATAEAAASIMLAGTRGCQRQKTRTLRPSLCSVREGRSHRGSRPAAKTVKLIQCLPPPLGHADHEEPRCRRAQYCAPPLICINGKSPPHARLPSEGAP
jgi:hypothetical protein